MGRTDTTRAALLHLEPRASGDLFSQVPLSVGRTLTRRHMRALPDVLRMMQRLDSCPFARLLRRHCPLKLRSARNGGSGERKGGSVGEERGMDGGLERGDGTGGHGEGRNGRGEEGQRGSGQDRRDVRAIKEGEDEVGAERVRGREVSSALHSDMSGAAGDGCSDVGASSGMGSEKGQKKGDGDVRCGGEGGSGGEREGGSGIRESAGEIEGSSESESEGSDEEGTGTSAKTRGPGHTDISAVARFVWAVVRWVVPETLLGDKRSRSALRRSIATLLCKKRHEGMTLGEAVRGLRTKTGPWACGKGVRAYAPVRLGRPLCRSVCIAAIHRGPRDGHWALLSLQGGRAEQRLAQRDTLCWTWFLMSWIVIPTLRAHFYATESEKHRYSVFYFRKADWARLRCLFCVHVSV